MIKFININSVNIIEIINNIINKIPAFCHVDDHIRRSRIQQSSIMVCVATEQLIDLNKRDYTDAAVPDCSLEQLL